MKRLDNGYNLDCNYHTMVKPMKDLEQEITTIHQKEHLEALLLNREMIQEIKDLLDDINHSKSSHLKQFIHPQWGSIVGSEEEIRLAALQDEVEIWERRTNKNPDIIPYLGYIRDTLRGRIEELKPPDSPDNVIQEHEATWGKEYE